jgi:hypothetical protein
VPAERPVPIAVAPPTALAQTKLETKPDWSELRAKLDRATVTGFVMVDREVTIFPTQDVTKPSSAIHGGAYVTVLEDDGPAIRVRTGMEKTGLAELDPVYDLEGFISRAALVPVLARAIVKDNPDGTGFVLREGLELSFGDRIAPANLLLAKLPLELSASDITLGFALPDKAAELAKLDGAELGCARGEHQATRIDDPATLRKERMDAWRREHPNAGLFESPYSFAGGRGYNEDPCRIAGKYDFEEHADRKDADLKVGGANLGKASAANLDHIEVRRGKGSDVLVTFSEPRAIVRALTNESVLAWGGGGAGMGGLGGKPPKVWAVQGPAIAWYADGTKAGNHVAQHRPTKMRGAHEVNGRMCYRVMHVAVEICHDKADLKEIDDTRW